MHDPAGAAILYLGAVSYFLFLVWRKHKILALCYNPLTYARLVTVIKQKQESLTEISILKHRQNEMPVLLSSMANMKLLTEIGKKAQEKMDGMTFEEEIDGKEIAGKVQEKLASTEDPISGSLFAGDALEDEVDPDLVKRQKGTVAIPESAGIVEKNGGPFGSAQESSCIFLQADAEEIVEVKSLEQRLMRMMGNMMGLSEDRIKYLDQMLGKMDFRRNEFYPKEQCVFAPRMASDNVVRILGHHPEDAVKPKGTMKLLVSSKPMVDEEGKCPIKKCESLPDAECMVVTPESASAQFTSRMDAQNGMGHTLVWLIRNVEGQKYVRTLDARLQVFSLFRDVIHSQGRSQRLWAKQSNDELELKVVPPPKAGETNMLMLSGSSYRNVLLQQRPSPQIPVSVNPLVGDEDEERMADFMKRLEKKAEGAMRNSKVSVVVKVKEGDGRERVRVDLIPLIYDDDELRTKEMRECIVDRAHINGCTLDVRRDLDYDIRIANVGEVAADVEVFAFDLPSKSPINFESQEPRHHEPRQHEPRQHEGGTWSPRYNVPMYWGIGVLLVALFAMIMNRRNNRKRASKRVMSASHIRGLDATLMESDAYTV